MVSLFLVQLFIVPISAMTGPEAGSDLDMAAAIEVPEPVSQKQPQRSRDTKIPLDYDDVLLVVNDNSQMSKDIADYFVARRPIPQNNICNITTSTTETVSRTIFTNEIRAPVEACIKDRDLEPIINYIITTKGVPLRVSGGGRAAVDSELSIIIGDLNNTIGGGQWTNSPYFASNEPISHEKFGVYIVTRLTAYTLGEVYNLIDLADNSTGSRGLFAFDAGGPYAEGDNWIKAANDTIGAKGYNTSYDNTNVFQMHYKDVIGYASWGSNGRGYGSNYCTNSGFENDGDSDTIPDNWVVETDGGTWERSSDTAYSNTYSAKIVRPAVTSDASIIGQNITILPDTRYWLSGVANLSSVSGDHGAHLFIRGFDATDTLVSQINASARTGSRNWYGMSQVHYEPIPGVTKIMVGAALSKSSGTAYFDSLALHVIRPNNTYVPGAIAETFVSTGGRSFTYGTSYGQSLVVDMVRQGISGISGHVYEPYLTACGRPQILFDMYTSGYTMGESFYMALPWVSWMEVVVGDPKMVPFWDVPDPAVEDNVTIDVVGPAVNEEITIKAKVYNRGNDVDNVKVEFYDGSPSTGVRLGDVITIPHLARDASLWVEVKHTFLEIKFETITVVVDKEDEIQEQREGNNQASVSFLVGTMPDLAVDQDDIVLTPEELLQGDPLILNVTTHNLGGVWTVMTGHVNITEVNGTFFESHDISVDPMNGTNITQVISTAINTSVLNGNLCVNVSLRSSRLESDLANNEAGKCIFIEVQGFVVEQITDELEAEPYGYANHSFNVTNLGNVDDHFTFGIVPSSTIWVTEIIPDHLDLGPGQTGTVIVRNFAAAGLEAGDTVEVNVTVSSTINGTNWDMVFRTTVLSTYEITMEMSYDEVELLPGDTADFEMILGNLGNTRDNITLSYDAPDNWTVVIDQEVSTLEPNLFATRTASVTVPEGAPADHIGIIYFTATSENGAPEWTRDGYVMVLQAFNISLELINDGDSKVAAGRPYAAKVVVHNHGNGNDTIELSGIQSILLMTKLDEDSVSMAPGKMTVGLTVTPSPKITPGFQTVKVYAKSAGGPEAEVSFALEVLKPDLAIKVVSAPDKDVKPGNIVTFTIEVWSQGSIQPGNFNVTMSARNNELERQQVLDLNGTDPRSLTFEWRSEEGSWQFTFMVDPDGVIAESNEDNNKVTQKVSVKSSSGGGPGSSSIMSKPGLLAMIILIPLVYLLLKIAIWHNRLKTAAEEGEAKRRKEREAADKEEYPESEPVTGLSEETDSPSDDDDQEGSGPEPEEEPEAEPSEPEPEAEPSSEPDEAPSSEPEEPSPGPEEESSSELEEEPTEEPAPKESEGHATEDPSTDEEVDKLTQLLDSLDLNSK